MKMVIWPCSSFTYLLTYVLLLPLPAGYPVALTDGYLGNK